MDFEFFEKLSREEAKVFLERFLAVESNALGEFLTSVGSRATEFDFRVQSVAAFMRAMLPMLVTVSKPIDPNVPEWIRNTDSYARTLFDFDEKSKAIVLRSAYYIGGSFVRSYSHLHWATGNSETAEGNMPVVTGFQKRQELAPILICKNLFGRVLADNSKVGDFEIAVEAWKNMV